VEIANLKQVNADIVQQADTTLRPDEDGQSQAEGDRTMQRRRGDAGVTQSEGHGLFATARRLWEGWKRVARKIGDFQARALMTLFYFLILAPVAMILRWRSDPLAIKAGTPRGWNAMRGREVAPMEQARRQF
jgi:hypothetical protein